MTAYIQGSVLSTVSLDSVSASMILSPLSSVVNKVQVLLPVAIANSTWANSGSNLVATVTCDNSAGIYVNAQKVAIYWANNGAGLSGSMYDGKISSAGASSFVATFPATYGTGTGVGAKTLPATNTAILIGVATEVVDTTFNGTNCKQLVITSSQPGTCLLKTAAGVAADPNTNVLATTLLNAGDFYGFPVTASDVSPVTGNLIVQSTLYNNSLSTALMSVVAGV